jgi:hypothetical protein
MLRELRLIICHHSASVSQSWYKARLLIFIPWRILLRLVHDVWRSGRSTYIYEAITLEHCQTWKRLELYEQLHVAVKAFRWIIEHGNPRQPWCAKMVMVAIFPISQILIAVEETNRVRVEEIWWMRRSIADSVSTQKLNQSTGLAWNCFTPTIWFYSWSWRGAISQM